MNYRKIHDDIIARAKRRRVLRSYFEKHHIIPRSLKGSDDAANIVKLTYREHFLIHWLLTKLLVRGRGHYAMIRAFNAMVINTNGRRVVSSWQYEMAKRVCADSWDVAWEEKASARTVERKKMLKRVSEKKNQRRANKALEFNPDGVIVIKRRHYRVR